MTRLQLSHLPRLLAPNLHKRPQGVTDAETLARFPQLDLDMSPSKRSLLRLRSAVVRSIRDTLERQSFMEVHTPILAADAGGAVATPFQTFSQRFPGQALFMRIAPELDLKKLIRIPPTTPSSTPANSTRHTPTWTVLCP